MVLRFAQNDKRTLRDRLLCADHEAQTCRASLCYQAFLQFIGEILYCIGRIWQPDLAWFQRI